MVGPNIRDKLLMGILQSGEAATLKRRKKKKLQFKIREYIKSSQHRSYITFIEIPPILFESDLRRISINIYDFDGNAALIWNFR